MSANYDFILYQWFYRKVTSDQVQTLVTKGYITQDEANTILSTAQI